jgi:O-antigen ligase
MSRDALAPPAARAHTAAALLFPALFGGLLGLTLVKFGNPVILGALLDLPQDPLEWVIFAWPVSLAYGLLLGVALVGGLTIPWRAVRWHWLAALPLVWLGWQGLAALTSVDPPLTRQALPQFAATVGCFYLGYTGLRSERSVAAFWTGLLTGFVVVLAAGWEQHWGGLAETRRQFFLYMYPQMKEVPPELLKRMTSNRIFATLFYPNTLAGVILLVLPGGLGFLWSLRGRLTTGARGFLLGALALGALACLVWSGSKAGWLLLLGLGLVALQRAPLPKARRLAIVGAVLVAGLSGFLWRYATFFQKGATSVSARFDYWQAATTTAAQHPWLGSGPGTFGVMYKAIKRPESEMARLVHNDYLQQASDSGVPGFLAYAGFVALALARARPRPGTPADGLAWAVWLGLLGWGAQSLFEFGLYIPGVAWPAFALLGWLLARAGNRIDNPAAAGSVRAG